MVLAWMGTTALCALFVMMMQYGGGCKSSPGHLYSLPIAKGNLRSRSKNSTLLHERC